MSDLSNVDHLVEALERRLGAWELMASRPRNLRPPPPMDPLTRTFMQVAEDLERLITDYPLPTAKEIEDHREELPISNHRTQILEALSRNSAVVVAGETGCGKSTQLPQFLYESGFIKREGRIAVTLPSSLAAETVAKRVALEMGERVGETVGFRARFEDKTGPRTLIDFITDDELLRMICKDTMLMNYNCVIIDSAHERNIHSDILLGLLRVTLDIRDDLKIVVVSSLMQAPTFVTYMGGELITIPSTRQPVKVKYSYKDAEILYPGHFPILEYHYMQEASRAVAAVAKRYGSRGNILVYLPSKECGVQLKELVSDEMSFPEYEFVQADTVAPLDMTERLSDSRKVYVATSAAETSVNVENIACVVDCGLFCEKVVSHGIEGVKLSVISQAEAELRREKVGIHCPGICLRLYSKIEFDNMPEFSRPGIKRQALTEVILLLKSVGVSLRNFIFLDRPTSSEVSYALAELKDVNALNKSSMEITKIGRLIAKFPLSPELTRTLMFSVDLGCAAQMITIIALLSAQSQSNVFTIAPRRDRWRPFMPKPALCDLHGDHVTLLNVYNEWDKQNTDLARRMWCQENFIDEAPLIEAKKIRTFLWNLLSKYHGPCMGVPNPDAMAVRRALVNGSAGNLAYRDRNDNQEMCYRLMSRNYKTAYIDPSSIIHDKWPDYIVYHKTRTVGSKLYLRYVSICDNFWVPFELRRKIRT